MRKIILFFVLFLSLNFLTANPWSEEYQQFIEAKCVESLILMETYPSFQYPNEGYENLGNEKVLLFGYGSLMGKNILDARGQQSIKRDNLKTMSPAIALGVQRIFNYEEKKGLYRDVCLPNERAMLNLSRSKSFEDFTNGVLFEIDADDLSRLVERELGYDLVPIFVVSWEDAMSENPAIEIKIAYTFMASSEPRGDINYTYDNIYPIRGYLRLVEEAARSHGDQFSEMFYETTYLADGVTTIKNWDRKFDKDLKPQKRSYFSRFWDWFYSS